MEIINKTIKFPKVMLTFKISIIKIVVITAITALAITAFAVSFLFITFTPPFQIILFKIFMSPFSINIITHFMYIVKKDMFG